MTGSGGPGTGARGRWRRGTSRGGGNGWRAIALFALLCSLLSTLAQPGLPVAAQDDGCDPGMVFDSDSGQCVEPTEEPAIPTEVPQPTETPAPTMTPTAEPVANVVINAFLCPPGYQSQAPGANMRDDCVSPANDITFTLSVASVPGVLEATTGDDVPGQASFSNITPGTITLTQKPDPALGASFNACTVGPMRALVQPGSTVTGPVAAGETLTCSWYNVLPSSTPTPTPTDTPTFAPPTPSPTPTDTPTFAPPTPSPTPTDTPTYVPPTPSPTPTDTPAPTSTGTVTATATIAVTSAANPTMVPTPSGFGDVAIVMQQCTGATYTSDADCAPITTGVEIAIFQLDVVPGLLISGTTDASGSHAFSTVPIGRYQLVLNGLTPCYVFAKQISETNQQFTAVVTDGIIEVAHRHTTVVTVSLCAAASTGADITVHKWTCPSGYNELLPGANPAVDCPTKQDGITFTLTDINSVQPTLQSTTGDSIPGAVRFGGTMPGLYYLAETIPSVIDRAFVTGCDVTRGETTTTTQPVVTGGIMSLQVGFDDTAITCNWYNVPKPATQGGTVIIHKQFCSGATYTSDADCTPQTTGVNFNLAMRTGSGVTPVGSGTTDASGTLQFTGLANGAYELTEVGGTPCNVTATMLYEDNQTINALNPDGSLTVTEGRETVVTVSNCRGTGDITVYKWQCPPGYDYTRPGANPPIECATAMNGVNFTLTDNAGVQPPLQTRTGDSIPGAVFFGGTPSGDYTLKEDVPPGIQQAFVWNCTGASTSWVNPIPLAVGFTLGITVANGDKIVCNWFNVPKPDPQTGDLTIHKQYCSGMQFTAAVDCDTFEGGATFQIQIWNGSAWSSVTTATTGATGVISLTGLAPGAYLVRESGGNPCKTTATQLDGNGKPVDVLNTKDGTVPVTKGKETVVIVYNCRVPGKTPVPVKTPSKYPNTGVDPDSGNSSNREQDTEIIQPDTASTGTPAEEDSGSTPVAVTCPALSNADGGTAVPVATPQPGALCARGAVPVSVRIPSIDVEATVEVKEILDGVMQEPSDEAVVTWYKETARLGERGNVVIAGHLNWWGFPEAVFFRLSELKPGDLIEVSDGNGGTFTYQVTAVRQMPNDDNPNVVVQGTDAETLTLITCSGEWDPAVSEYNSRTVVQAVRVDAGAGP